MSTSTDRTTRQRATPPLAIMARFDPHSDQTVTRNLRYIPALFLTNRYGAERFGYVPLKARRDIACGVRDLDQVIHVIHVHDCILPGFFRRVSVQCEGIVDFKYL